MINAPLTKECIWGGNKENVICIWDQNALKKNINHSKSTLAIGVLP